MSSRTNFWPQNVRVVGAVSLAAHRSISQNVSHKVAVFANFGSGLAKFLKLDATLTPNIVALGGISNDQTSLNAILGLGL